MPPAWRVMLHRLAQAHRRKRLGHDLGVKIGSGLRHIAHRGGT
jgi:hypothetical protein